MAAPINDLDNAELIRQREADILWASEKEIRLRCDGLTPLETLGLRKNFLWQSDTTCFYNDAEGSVILWPMSWWYCCMQETFEKAHGESTLCTWSTGKC